ncbi:LysE family transporter [Spongiivirga sp. MCCC 1A20706]|uniref:LysE family translocator n=1 Tax=Spongiivirga sp. MCCC 1A20706 TaxID=3160963 RepID=UPI003977A6C0
MFDDIVTAIPWGILLAFTIGPVFFVLLETSAIRGFRAALVFDIGVIFADIVFILVAYLSTNQILEKLKDDPALFIFGGILLLAYGIISFIKLKKDYKKSEDETAIKIDKNNYFSLFFKGFLLNFINIGVLGFWLGVIIVFGPKLNMDANRIITFFSTILASYLAIDVLKILLAKQLKSKLTSYRIYKVKKVISIILAVFGVVLISQGLFPGKKEQMQHLIEEKIIDPIKNK